MYVKTINKEIRGRTTSVEVSLPAPPTVSEKTGCFNAWLTENALLGRVSYTFKNDRSLGTPQRKHQLKSLCP